MFYCTYTCAYIRINAIRKSYVKKFVIKKLKSNSKKDYITCAVLAGDDRTEYCVPLFKTPCIYIQPILLQDNKIINNKKRNKRENKQQE